MDNIKKSYWVELIKKLPTMMFGLLLYSIGILATLYSKLGMSPWDVLHMGVVKHSSLTLGQASEITGFIIILISVFIGVVPGLASIFNMIFIGVFIDIVQKLAIFRTPDSLIGRILMLGAGILIIGWATYFYLKVNIGAGPRDGLMEGLVKKLNKPVWMIRGSIEALVLIIGYFLGGPVGIGTLITAGTIGFSVQLAFKIGKYNSKDTEHVNLLVMYKKLRGYDVKDIICGKSIEETIKA